MVLTALKGDWKNSLRVRNLKFLRSLNLEKKVIWIWGKIKPSKFTNKQTKEKTRWKYMSGSDKSV